MPSWALTVDAAVDVVVAIVYAVVGRQLSTSHLEEPRPAENAFAAWWYGLAATALVIAATDMLVWSGHASLGFMAASSILSLVAFSIAVGGIATHAAFVLTGRAWVVYPIVAVYLLFDLAQVFLMVGDVPRGIRVDGWRAVLDSTTTLSLAHMLTMVGILLLPPLLVAFAYVADGCLPKRDRARRERSLLIGGSLLGWCASVAVIAIPALAGNDVAQAGARLIVIASAGALWLAYREPSRASRPLRSPSRASRPPSPVDEPSQAP